MALGRSDGLQFAIGDGVVALDAEARRDRLDGFAVVSGLAVTVKSGLTLSIASGTATVGESSGTVDTVSLGSSTDTTLQSADANDPRKDTVYIDTNGDIQVETGTAEPYQPSGSTLFDTWQPEPPLPSTEGVVLAEVVVPAGASSINTSDHVRDRRQPAQASFDEVHARTTTTGSLSVGPDGLTALWAKNDPYEFTASAQNSITVTDINSFTTLLIKVGASDLNGNANEVNIQTNGVTSGYKSFNIDGTKTTGQTAGGPISTISKNGSSEAYLLVTTERNGTAISVLNGRAFQKPKEIYGGNTSGLPLDSVTFLRGVATDWEVRIWGRDPQ
jgi:hypothetical protein